MQLFVRFDYYAYICIPIIEYFTSAESIFMKQLITSAIIVFTLIACNGSSHHVSQEDHDKVVALNDSGGKYRNKSDFTKAIEFHQEALDYAKQCNDSAGIVMVSNSLATDMRRIGNYDDALALHLEALRISELMASDTSYQARKNLVRSYNGLGNVQMAMGDNSGAEESFRHALKGETELGSTVGMAINYANIGSIKRNEGMPDSARLYYIKSLEYNEVAGSTVGIGLCHTYLGELAERDGDFTAALQEYSSAYDLLASTDDEWHTLTPLVAMARTYVSQGNMELAEKTVDQALEVSTEIGSMSHTKDAMELKAILEENKGNMASALNYFKQSKAINDSLLNYDMVVDMGNVRMKYEYKRGQRDYETMKEMYGREHSEKNISIVLCIIFAVLATIIACLIHYLHKSHKTKLAMIRAAEESQKMMFTNISHEFRTPLTIISGLSERMANGKMAESEKEEALKSITHHSDTLCQLVNQLLDVSKNAIDNTRNEKWTHGNISAYMRMIAETHSVYAREKDISLTFNAPVVIETDFVEEYIERIMNNLVANALKYTPVGGWIKVEVAEESDELTLKVSDSGNGVKKDELESIFGFFKQGSNSGGTVGSGIGLAYVRSTVNHLGGTVTAHNGIGYGLVVTVKIPLKSVLPDADSNTAEHQDTQDIQEETVSNKPTSYRQAELVTEASTIIAENQGKPSVLIVEDNDDLRQYLNTLLSEKYETIMATNGEEALKRIRSHIPSIIVTDIMMPKMDGFELCRRVRSSADTNHIPIVVVTARVGEEDRIRGLKAGVDAYLMKPFKAEELMLRVEHLLTQQKIMMRTMYEAMETSNQTDEELNNDMTQKSDWMPKAELSPKDQQLLKACQQQSAILLTKNQLTAESLSSAIGMSYSQLNRRLKSCAGCTVNIFIENIKITKARRLLATTQTPIGEIAIVCGFQDNSYFSRTFKKRLNITPSQYRDQFNE